MKFLRTFLFVFISATAFSQADTIRLMFTGDIMAHGPQLKAAYNPQTRTYDFSDSFIYLKKIFRDADFVIGNLETTLGTKPYTGYPRFSAPAALAAALKEAGFTHLVTANNHSCDKGRSGIIKTVRILDSLQIGHTGTYASLQEKTENPFIILEKKGFKILVLNYTYGTNGLPVPAGTQVNLTDTARMKSDIERAKTYRPDEIIVFLHWGNQYQAYPSAYQKQIEKFLHRQGIRIIIGSHPHVIQPVRSGNGKLTVYSLGNFISNQRTFPRDGAFIFRLDLIKKDGRTQILRHGYIPFWVYKYNENGKTYFEVLPTDEFIIEKAYFTRKTDFEKFLRFHRYITGFMKGNAKETERILDYVPRYQIKKLNPVLPGITGFPEIPVYRVISKR
jgi:poly-gamma-glutamate synthesis protein (capsule biosynthesis protein)